MNFKIFGVSVTTIVIGGLLLWIGMKYGRSIPLLKGL